jgi:hypothetical protein
MLKQLLMWSAAFALGLVACNKDTSPPEDFVGVMESGGHRYSPVSVPNRKAEGLLGPIAAAEQPAEKKGEKEGAGEAPKIDSSSAQAIGDSFVKMVNANEWKYLPSYLVPEQAEGFKPIIDAVAPFATAVGELNKAAREKFEGHAVVITVSDTWLQHLVDMANELKVEVQPAGDEEAKVIFTAGPADAADARKIECTAKKTDQGWRLALPDFQAPSDPNTVTTALEGKADGFKDIAARIGKDDLKDAEAAKAEAEKVMAGSYKPAEGAKEGENAGGAEKTEAGDKTEPKAEEPRAEEPKADARPAPRPQRPRDEVDNTVSSPVLPRGN